MDAAAREQELLAKLEEQETKLQEMESALETAGRAGAALLQQNERLREQIDKKIAEEEEESRLEEENKKSETSAQAKLEKLERGHKEMQQEYEGLQETLKETEIEVSIYQKENEKMRKEMEKLKESNAVLESKLASVSSKTKEGQAHNASYTEKLKEELLDAAVMNKNLTDRVTELEEEKGKLEHTVSSLMRECQRMSDEMMESSMMLSERHPEIQMDDAFNTSLADELGMGMEDSPPPSQEKAVAGAKDEKKEEVKTQDEKKKEEENKEEEKKSLFADMAIVEPPKKSEEELRRERSDRQYKEYVYMTVTAVKISMTIQNGERSDLLLKLSPKKVYIKAIEKKVPLHLVHGFVRKYALAYLEQSQQKQKPQVPKQGFFARVMTTYFPATDYLFRTSEVVPNRGSALGSFLYKRGSFLSRGWKQRWFKLNPDLDVISWHVDPHILNSLGTIPLSEVGKIEVVEEGMSPYDHVFMIQTIMGRQYYLAAESKTILQYWVDGINNALADLARDKADRSSAHLTLGTSSKPSPPPSSSSTSSSSPRRKPKSKNLGKPENTGDLIDLNTLSSNSLNTSNITNSNSNNNNNNNHNNSNNSSSNASNDNGLDLIKF